MQPKTISATLKSSRHLTKSVKEFTIELEGNAPFQYLAGQFITLYFDVEGQRLRRSYSIATPPDHTNCLSFAAGYVEKGKGSEYLFNLKEGDILSVAGPYGRLVLKAPYPKRLILVATSTGVTPYCAMLEELSALLDANPALSVVLLQGVQTKEDILYQEDWLSFQARFVKQVTCRFQLSREHGSLLAAPYFSGYVQSAFTELNLKAGEDRVYLCGNPQMIDEAYHHLQSLGFEASAVIREKYIS